MLFFYKKPYDYLRFTGNDRLDLIDRLSTNEVKNLEKSKGIKTILTTDKGRFVDLITLYSFGDSVFVTCSFNNSRNVTQHLEKYTITDDFKTEDVTGTHETVLIYGEGLENFLKEVFSIKTEDFRNNDFLFHLAEEKHAIIARNDDAFGGCNLIYAKQECSFYLDRILGPETSSKFEIKELNDVEYETRRIEYGVPKLGNEMSGITNPLECGMAQYISFTKGCYIGQEVIARLDTYDKISKHLVGIVAEDEIPEIDQHKQSGLTVDNIECGFVTSSAFSENYGNIGLGFVKTILLDYGKKYRIKSNGNAINCRITKLPFK